MPPPIAMYSNSFVGEPKKRLSTMWLLCGETKMSHAFSSRAPSALRHAANRLHARLQPGRSHRIVDEVLVGAVADQQEPRVRRFLADARDRRGQHVDAVPAAEGAREADHAIGRRETELAAKRRTLLGPRGRVDVRVGAVGIHQDLVAIDAARDQRLADGLRHDADQRRLPERGLFRERERGLVREAAAVEASPHRDLGAVVFDDVRDLVFAADQARRRNCRGTAARRCRPA